LAGLGFLDVPRCMQNHEEKHPLLTRFGNHSNSPSEKIQQVSEQRKAPAFNTQGELSVRCPYCQKLNIFPESETLDTFTCEFCGETVEIEESVE